VYLQTRLSVDVGDELATHVRRTWAEGVEKDIWARPGGGGGGGQDNGENSTRNFIIPTYSMKQSPS